ncbi:hypothetical protein RRG08_024825 [Elysia crispata]|uniref:Uncharacterized protein n=1 Tax=Elysia crispata TaxID=231223 RepID=A0AAE1D0C1_9GAST|nr:hypothetical protein RRG08_024825 [Elysia crispata]
MLCEHRTEGVLRSMSIHMGETGETNNLLISKMGYVTADMPFTRILHSWAVSRRLILCSLREQHCVKFQRRKTKQNLEHPIKETNVGAGKETMGVRRRGAANQSYNMS